ncbi:LysR family transcriptional regulator [Demetria terragena]|uniref:LysR family transcriptional regulator n=1 Tax=Demetria terragena TaxID=63959 RepID=UPI00036EE53A|nr:LysR family transcriptional regulator [Demetria terragena]
MNLRQTEHFLAVVNHGGVARAATALGLAQPSLSQSIRTLERELGDALFHRSSRGMVLTDAGRELIEPARRLVRDVATARASVAEHAGLFGGHLEVAALPQAFNAPLPDVVGRVRRRFPSVTFRLRECVTEAELARLVRSGSVDLGLGYCQTDDEGRLRVAEGLVAEPLLEDAMYLALPSSVAAGLPDPLSFKDIPNIPVVAVNAGAVSRSLVESALRHAGRRTQLGVVTTHRQMVLPLIAEGGVMCWITESQVADAPAGVAVRLMEPTIIFVLAMVHRPGLLSPWARAFQEEAVALASVGRSGSVGPESADHGLLSNRRHEDSGGVEDRRGGEGSS